MLKKFEFFYALSAFHVANTGYLRKTDLDVLALGEIFLLLRSPYSFFIFLFKSKKFGETRLRNQFLLLIIEFNDEDNYIIFCKKAFSDVLDGVT